MIWTIFLLIATAVYFFASFYFEVLPKWLAIIPFCIAIIIEIRNHWQKKERDEGLENFQKQFQIIIEQQNQQELSNEKIKELEKERNEIENSLNDVNEKLEHENISKKELIKDLNDDLEVVLLIKHTEGEKEQKEPKHIREALKRRGFRSINYGMYILPPYLSPSFTDVEKMNKWVDKNFLSKISEDYRYKMSILLVDLNKVLVKEQGDTQMKSIIEKLEYTDLVKLDKLNEYVKKKKDISIMDIIQIPKLKRLVEVGHFGYNDKKTILEMNDEIIKEMSKYLGKEDVKTKDLCKLDKQQLINILDKYNIRNKEVIANDIIKNSKFWSQF